MLLSLQKILQQSTWQNSKIIVAVSGGADSMALASLLKNTKVNIVIAHCNFGLRYQESDADEEFVTNWANENNIQVFVKHFALQDKLRNNSKNIQLLARNLRYEWFEKLRNELNFDFIAVAHHKQDAVETLLYNFLKGTGIAGLHGILPQNGKIIRPLLDFSKEQLMQYCTENNINWREDSSNKKDTYTRNNIRHNLIPLLNDIVPNAVDNLFQNTKRFSEVEMIYNQRINQLKKKLIEKRNDDYYIAIRKIKNYQPLYTILFELLKPFSFTSSSITDVVKLLDAESGKQVISATHKIIKDRNFLIVTHIVTEKSTHISIAIPETGKTEIKFGNCVLTTRKVTGVKNLACNNNEAYIDVTQLVQPIILRPQKTGDYFYPFGMGMKKKKVSRYLIDQKVPVHEKENVWVLESNKRIVWVIGFRTDERFKVKNPDGKLLHLQVK